MNGLQSLGVVMFMWIIVCAIVEAGLLEARDNVILLALMFIVHCLILFGAIKKC